MKILRYLILIAQIILVASSVYAAVTTSPSSINTAKGSYTGVTITYTFGPPAPPPDGIISSPSGNFLVGATNIGSISTPLSTNIQNGRGQVSETITIPPGVVERALRQGSGTFSFQRIFAGTQTATITIWVTSESIAEFSLRRIELYFDGKKKSSETIVNRNHKGLRAYADIYFNGSGFLKGYWEIDGRVIENISRYISFGAKTSLVTPDIPGLPTFEPGFHIIKFVVTNPQPPFELPQILYWVAAKEEPVKMSLNLLAPKDSALIALDDEFKWDKMEGVSVYLVTFIKEDDRRIVFSALTRDNYYRIPQPVLSQYFTKDIKYLWHVKGYNGEGNIVAGSEERRIRLR